MGASHEFEGLHPSEHGYNLMARTIYDYVAEWATPPTTRAPSVASGDNPAAVAETSTTASGKIHSTRQHCTSCTDEPNLWMKRHPEKWSTSRRGLCPDMNNWVKKH